MIGSTNLDEEHHLKICHRIFPPDLRVSSIVQRLAVPCGRGAPPEPGKFESHDGLPKNGQFDGENMGK